MPRKVTTTGGHDTSNNMRMHSFPCPLISYFVNFTCIPLGAVAHKAKQFGVVGVTNRLVFGLAQHTQKHMVGTENVAQNSMREYVRAAHASGCVVYIDSGKSRDAIHA